eukprot:2919866-Pleurochrysis_carterae.AAC.1
MEVDEEARSIDKSSQASGITNAEFARGALDSAKIMGHVRNKHNCINTFEMHGRQVQYNYQLWGIENSDATTTLAKRCTEFLKQGSKKRGLD